MPYVTVKTRTQHTDVKSLVAAAQAKANDIMKRSPTSDRVLVVYEKNEANIYYERKRKTPRA